MSIMVRPVHQSLSGTFDCKCEKNYEGDGFDHCEPNEYCIEGKNYKNIRATN